MDEPQQQQRDDDEWVRRGYIKCAGGYRHAAYPNDPPFSAEDLKRFAEIGDRFVPKRQRRRRR